jgi:hypothetical protein
MAYIYAITELKSKARVMLRALEQQAKRSYIPHLGLAVVRVGLRENERAVAELEKADQEGEPLDGLNTESRFSPLQKDPRFLVLLRKHGFSTVKASASPNGK